jgi:hypothetical protein
MFTVIHIIEENENSNPCIHPFSVLQPLLGPAITQKMPPFFTVFPSSPPFSYFHNLSLWMMASHLVLGFPTDLVL